MAYHLTKISDAFYYLSLTQLIGIKNVSIEGVREKTVTTQPHNQHQHCLSSRQRIINEIGFHLKKDQQDHPSAFINSYCVGARPIQQCAPTVQRMTGYHIVISNVLRKIN